MMLFRMAAACALLLGAGCSMFREGEPVTPEAALNGDAPLADAPLTVADVVAAAAGAPPLRGASEPPSAGRAAPSDAAIPAQSVLYGVHLASYRSEGSAAAGWRILSTAVPEVLRGLQPRIQSVDLGPDRGVYLRLKAGPLDSRAEATALCAALVETGRYCQPIGFDGRDISG